MNIIIFIFIFIDRRNKTIIRNLHINGGVGVQTLTTSSGLAISTFFFPVKLGVVTNIIIFYKLILTSQICLYFMHI